MTLFSSIQTFLFFMFTFIVSMIFIRVTWISFQSKTKKNLPPSPRKLPIIGNMHQLGLNQHQSLHDLSEKHGPVMLLHYGSVPMLIVSSARVAQEILKTHDLTFASRPDLHAPKILTYGYKNIGFSPYTEYWRQLKSITMVHLLNNSRVKSFQQVRKDEVSRLIDNIGEIGGRAVDLGSLLSSLSNNIICRVAFGRTYDSKFLSLLTRYVNCLGYFSVGDYIPWLWWVDLLTGLHGRVKRTAEDLDNFLEGVVEEHVNKKKGVIGSQNGGFQDLVDVLLDLQKENTVDFVLHKDSIKAVILDMFAAGTDTTSTTLVWTISELIKNPETMKKLQQEVTEVSKGRFMIQEDDLVNMHYLRAVIKESLRLHPALPLLVQRLSTKDVELMGYDVSRDTQVLVNVWAIGRDPDNWEEPTKFKPERFLKNPIDYRATNFNWLPFGAGRRGCPGIQFGVVVMELALANIVNKYNLALEDGFNYKDLDMSEVFGLTLRKKSPLMVIPSPRF